MWFNAAADDELWPPAALLQASDRFHGHDPALIRIEAADLEQQEVPVEGLPQAPHARGIRRVEEALGYTVGHDQGVYANIPHDMLHVLAYGKQARHEAQPPPVHPVERKDVIGVP
ncbi:MAG: hypothetical protein C4289_09320 [Chloroflexota bacterium]